MESAPSEGPTDVFQILNAGRQRARTQIARQIDGLFLAAEAGDAAGVLDLGFNGGHADRLVVQHHGQFVADVGFGVTAEALAGVGREGEIGLPSADIALAGTRVAHLLAADNGVLANQIPLLAFTAAARLHLHQLGVERQNAALLRQRRFAAGIRTILHVVDLEHSRGADQFPDARGIVHARQLHQNLVIGAGVAVLLHGFFG